MNPVAALEEIALLLERHGAATYRVKAFRGASAAVGALSQDEMGRRIQDGTLVRLKGVGPVSAEVIAQAWAGEVPAYLKELRQHPEPDPGPAAGLLAALRGDLHVHSDWSDGGSPIDVMARTARDLGHDYIALTDHSERLTVARGLDRDRRLRQIEAVRVLNDSLSPFRILLGIEVDILDDGTLDIDDDVAGLLDVVVASVHSKLRMPSSQMTPRMVAAVANPAVAVLGHCTGRMVTGRGRPESAFEADAVFEACRRFDVAVEINCRPERLDPPRRLLRAAVAAGCLFALDTDAHAPGQLTWQSNGAVRAVECGVPPARVVNTWMVDDVLAWRGRPR